MHWLIASITPAKFKPWVYDHCLMFLLCRFLPLNRRCHTLYGSHTVCSVYCIYLYVFVYSVYTRNNTFMLQYVSNSIFSFLLLFFIKDFLFLYFLSLCLALIFLFWRTPSICLFFSRIFLGVDIIRYACHDIPVQVTFFFAIHVNSWRK